MSNIEYVRIGIFMMLFNIICMTNAIIQLIRYEHIGWDIFYGGFFGLHLALGIDALRITLRRLK